MKKKARVKTQVLLQYQIMRSDALLKALNGTMGLCIYLTRDRQTLKHVS